MKEANFEQSQQFDNQSFLAGLNKENQTLETPQSTEQTREITLKYNGKLCKMPFEQAMIYAQKGMNYDRMKEQRDIANAKISAMGQQIREPQGETNLYSLETGWLDFIEKYPEISQPQQQLSEEVWREIEMGVSPCHAYLEHQNKKLVGEIKKLKLSLLQGEQNALAFTKSPGSVASHQIGGNASDPFLQGLTEGF